MRHPFLLVPVLVAAIASAPAQAATPYGAQYGDQQQSPVWEDVPPVQLDVPGHAPAPAYRSSPPAAGWHDHADQRDMRAEAPAATGSGWQDSRGWIRTESHDQRMAWGHRHGGRGWTLPSYWMSPAYAVSNWQFYGLGRPDRGQHWVRYYDDALLVDDRGIVIASVDDLDWDRPAFSDADRSYAASGGYGEAYRSGYGAAMPMVPYGAAVAPPAVAYAAPLVTTYAGPGYATTTIVQAPPVVTTTTTTTTYVEDDVTTRRIVRAAPRRVVRHRPRRITCCCLCR